MSVVANAMDGEKIDVKQVLLEFWLDAIQSAPDYSDRLKASDNLAKYFLTEGKVKVSKGIVSRPATSDILRLVEEEEQSLEE